MSTPIIINGARGRMGQSLVSLVQTDAACTLAGLLEHETHVDALKHHACVVGTRPDEVLSAVKQAVIIDFSAPEVSIQLAKCAAQYGHGMVIGTTGFTQEQKELLHELATQTPLFWAPNMSIGVNVLLHVLPQLVRMLGEEYDLEMVELHHNRKKDSPSGTALRLAECLAAARDWALDDVACYHREGIIGERAQKELGIQTIRGGDVVGVHTMYFMGPGERIEVTHHAHSRETFAQGAVRAAKWLKEKTKGRLYSMDDIF